MVRAVLSDNPVVRARADLDSLLGLRLQPLLTGFLHDIRGGPVQVERRLLDGPDDVRIHGRQELSFVAGTAAALFIPSSTITEHDYPAGFFGAFDVGKIIIVILGIAQSVQNQIAGMLGALPK